MAKADLEGQMRVQLRAAYDTGTIPYLPAEQVRFHDSRKWRLDFAWEDKKIALEVEGLSSKFSRHQSIAGYRGDCEKYNEAALLGWVIIRVVDTHIRGGVALKWIERALK